MAVVVDMLRNQCCNSSYQMINHNLIVVREVVSLANTICILNGQRFFLSVWKILVRVKLTPFAQLGTSILASRGVYLDRKSLLL